MSNIDSYLEGSLNPRDALDTVKYNMNFAKEHPDYFYPDGLIIFEGGQGSGKSLSVSSYVQNLIKEYPNVILCSNMNFFGIPEDIQYVPYCGIQSLTDVENGEKGVIYVIDEIQLEFNSLESKNIPAAVFTEISQQRKQRKHIIGTTQVFGRVAKPFREQVKYLVKCSNYLKLLQVNHLIDAQKVVIDDNDNAIADNVKTFFWFHSPALYNSYDTYEKIKRYRNEWKGGKS